MNTFSIKSPGPVAPGAVFEQPIYFAVELHCQLDFDPPTCASFTLERIADISASDALMQTGQRGLKGFYLRARNSSAAARIFTATAKLVWDAERSQANLADVVERDWKAAHDRAKASLS